MSPRGARAATRKQLDADEPCGACNKKGGYQIWIGCENKTCSKWFHTKCVGLLGLDQKEVDKLKNWVGPCCQDDDFKSASGDDRYPSSPVVMSPEDIRKIVSEILTASIPAIVAEVVKAIRSDAGHTTNSIPRDEHRTNIGIPSSKLNVLIFGLEEEQGTWEKRREELDNKVCRVMREMDCKAEETVTDYRRIGKYQDNKKRPILITLGSVWTKRKVSANYKRLVNSDQAPEYVVKDDVPLTPAFKAAKLEARRKNDEIKEKATKSGKARMVSFSAQRDGSVVKYEKKGGVWTKVHEPDDQEASRQ